MASSSNVLFSGKLSGRSGVSPNVSAVNVSSRHVNFPQSTAQQGKSLIGTSILPVQKFQGHSGASREGSQGGPNSSFLESSASQKPAQSRPQRMGADAPVKQSGNISFSRVQAAGGAQRSLGSEPDYWAYSSSSPQMATAASRIFSVGCRHDEMSAAPEAASKLVQSQDMYKSNAHMGRSTSSTERLIGLCPTAATHLGKESDGTAAIRQALDALNNKEDIEEFEQIQDPGDWDEQQQAEEEQTASDRIADALWKKQASHTSSCYPICSRTARERCAYTTSDDWAIFALHNQYVRPLRDREWVPGEPCIIRKDSFELPPGACRYSESSCGLPATAFDSFVFPNPPRPFLMARRSTSGILEFGPPSFCCRAGRARLGDRRPNPQLKQQQLLDLERMLWFDPEPRLERPFRLYADSKACLKGPIHDIGHIMRSGW